MLLELTRPLVVFDLETTSADVKTCEIIQFGAVRVEPDGETRECEYLLEPEKPITPEATAVHGITNEDVEGVDFAFHDAAEMILGIVNHADLAGYNLKQFDVPILQRHFARELLTWEYGKVIDVYELYRRYRPMTLEQAVLDYLGREHEGAHGALDDAQATWQVLEAQIVAHRLPQDIEGLSKAHMHEDWIDEAGRFRWRGTVPVIAFGKHAGTPLSNVDRGYLQWMLKQEFQDDTLDIVRRVLEGGVPERMA